MSESNTAGDSRGYNWAKFKDVAAPVPRGVGCFACRMSGSNTAEDSRGYNWARFNDVAAPVPRGVGCFACRMR
ncbi:hypothetical protein Caka_0259 [Coraliomargarita akajimensis DSM 45221]|uniref:Uncharacterized protein n=1 Tax=Coraliomargarita akajimensis (strain DSM 45221 / IAM 15411 / JCM 23193 / KCTC 12865 / 04OKA010-24) TaxID=583355 RepID=D5ELW0_CORAD|nr:hypothetical protein Caka_0259 [Coraliomargarita akajimensis DSM 45221]